MHELSIATNIIEFAEEFARDHQVTKINRIEIEVGRLSGIVIDSLEFALELAVKDTVMEYTEVVITEIPGNAKCDKCGTIFEIQNWASVCPECQSAAFEIIGGKEMQIRSIFIDS